MTEIADLILLWVLWRWLLLNYWSEGLGGCLALLIGEWNLSDLYCIETAFFQKHLAHASLNDFRVGRLWKVPVTTWQKAACDSQDRGTPPVRAGLPYAKRGASDQILPAQQCREVQKNDFSLAVPGRREASGAGPKPCFGLRDSSVQGFSQSLPALRCLLCAPSLPWRTTAALFACKLLMHRAWGP